MKPLHVVAGVTIGMLIGVALWEFANVRGLVLNNTLTRNPSWKSDLAVADMKPIMGSGVLVQLQAVTPPQQA